MAQPELQVVDLRSPEASFTLKGWHFDSRQEWVVLLQTFDGD